jgi:hypothetical protein
LDEAVPARLLGFGYQHTDGLACLAGVSMSARLEVARLGALFNLGIVLFDRVCDRFPSRASLLFERATPDFLDATLSGDTPPPTQTGDSAIDFLLALIVNFFAGTRALAADARGDDRRGFTQLIYAMYRAERFATEATRDRATASLHVWRELRRKSSLPMRTMAHLALLPLPGADETVRSAVHSAAGAAGEAMWIVDDLADVGEDLEAGCWSRPLWLLTRTLGQTPVNGRDAIQQLLDTGIAAAEAHRLAKRLVRLRSSTIYSGGGLMRSVQATLHAWLEALPG